MNKGKVFIDSDVILDVLMNREPHVHFSQQFVALVEANVFEGFTSALILANCHYIISNQMNKTVADVCIQQLRSFLKVLPFTDKEIGESLSSGFKDFEAGVQYYIAVNNRINTILTRNTADYRMAAGVKIISPKEFILEMDID
ncbi:MAG: PIN domain-containing protein [Spirochaetales bacterium]|nr:PIN domain-containing protein [Spirochaetales bacterium]